MPDRPARRVRIHVAHMEIPAHSTIQYGALGAGVYDLRINGTVVASGLSRPLMEALADIAHLTQLARRLEP